MADWLANRLNRRPSHPPSIPGISTVEIKIGFETYDPAIGGRALRSFHRALRLGAALRAHVADVIQFPGDWHDALGLHWLFAAGTSDNRQGFKRFTTHAAIPRIQAVRVNSSFVAFSSRRAESCGCDVFATSEQKNRLMDLSLSETSSGWRVGANRAMLSPDVGPLQTDLVGARPPVPTESKA